VLTRYKVKTSVTATIMLAACMLLVGCVPLLPSRPVAKQPISVTSLGDRLSWVQCNDDAMRLTYVSARIREDGGQEREWPVFNAEGGAEDAVTIPPQVPIDMDASFVGLPIRAENDISLSSLQGTITVFLVLSGPDMRAEMAFRNIDVRSLIEGKFVYESGSVSDEPCAMLRTDPGSS